MRYEIGDIVEYLVDENPNAKIFIEVYVGYGGGYDITFEIDKDKFVNDIKNEIEKDSYISYLKTNLSINESGDVVFWLRDRCI